MDENTPTLLEQLQGKVNQLEAAVNAEMSKPPSPPKEHTLETALKEKLGGASPYKLLLHAHMYFYPWLFASWSH